MKTLMMLLMLASTAPLAAAECPYVQALDGSKVVFQDPLHFTISADWLTEPIKCETPDNRLSKGPFTALCDGVESTYSFFPGPAGDVGQTMVLDGEAYYRHCN